MKRSRLAPLLAAAVLAAPGALLAHADKPAAGAQAQQPQITPLRPPAGQKGTPDPRAYFTDTELLSQDGARLRFYSDALQGKTVLINVVYTNCKDACPLITQKLNQVRALVGERFGRDVFFISLTSDPERDSPAMLKQFADRQSADVAGWSWLTGRKEDVERVLQRLGQLSRSVEEHSTLLIAGNVPAKRWSKIRPDAPPEAIAERLQLLAGGAPPGTRGN